MTKNKEVSNAGAFAALGLSANLVRAVGRKGYRQPTPIQRKCITPLLNKQDVVGMARTGSGKTAAFVLPLLQHLGGHSVRVGARGLILSPSRELAIQTHKVIKDFSKGSDLRIILLVGGDGLEEQFTSLATNPDIIVATPGRLMHVLVETGLSLRTIEHVIWDEADRLLEDTAMANQVNEINARLPKERQTALFSATLPKALADFAQAGLVNPLLVRLDTDAKLSEDLKTVHLFVQPTSRDAMLLLLLDNIAREAGVVFSRNSSNAEFDQKKLLESVSIKRTNIPKISFHPLTDIHNDSGRLDHDTVESTDESHTLLQDNLDMNNTDCTRKILGGKKGQMPLTVIFVSTKHHVEYLQELLGFAFGLSCTYIYGALDQVARRNALEDFRRGRKPILIVTDVAARGIDVPLLDNVINYDFPPSAKLFVHRVGRVARAGRPGTAYTFVTPEDVSHLFDLQLFLCSKSDDTAADLNEVLKKAPQHLIDAEEERIALRVGDSAVLQSLKGVLRNANKLYRRTRPAASPESHRRAKNPNERILPERIACLPSFSHFDSLTLISNASESSSPLLNVTLNSLLSAREGGAKNGENIGKSTKNIGNHLSAPPAATSTQEEMLSAIRNYRPKNEEKALKHRSSILSVATSEQQSSKAQKDMGIKRTEWLKRSAQESGYALLSGGSRGTSFVEAARDAILDVDLRRGKKTMGIFDDETVGTSNAVKKRARREEQEGRNKLVATGFGTRVKASFRSDAYEKWRKHSHLEIQRPGETESSAVSSRASHAISASGERRQWRNKKGASSRNDRKRQN